VHGGKSCASNLRRTRGTHFCVSVYALALWIMMYCIGDYLIGSHLHCAQTCILRGTWCQNDHLTNSLACGRSVVSLQATYRRYDTGYVGLRVRSTQFPCRCTPYLEHVCFLISRTETLVVNSSNRYRSLSASFIIIIDHRGFYRSCAVIFGYRRDFASRPWKSAYFV